MGCIPHSGDQLWIQPSKCAYASQASRQNLQSTAKINFRYIYVPDKLATNPPIVVAIHYCTGSAQAYYQGTAWASNADSKGFLVIYPSSPHSGTCWDVSSKATLTHNGGGDSNSIANMVTYAISKYNADKTKVFVTGASSGGVFLSKENKEEKHG